MTGRAAKPSGAPVGRSGDFAALLAGCRPLVPATLIDAAGWSRVLRCGRGLPASVVDGYFGFECDLAASPGDADLAVAVPAGSRLARHLFAAEARAAGSPLGGAKWAASLGDLVLEYDLAGFAPGAAPPPGIFVPGKFSNVAELFGALSGAVGWRGEAKLRQAAERVAAALPDGKVAVQAGVMPGRAPRALRIVVWGIAERAIAAFLARAGWPGPSALVEASLAAIGDAADSMAVALAIGADGPAPRLGLELYGGPKWYQADRTAWRPLIDRAQALGWCRPAKAAGLRAWPRIDRLLGDGAAYRVRQGIHHLKVVIEPGAATFAKGYLAMELRAYLGKA